MFVEEYKSNGKVIGHYYQHAKGLILILFKSGAKNKYFLHKYNAWKIETRIIKQAEYKGCFAIGVMHKVGKVKMMYLTPLKNYLGEPSEPHYENGKEPMRRLQCLYFPINTQLSANYIASKVKIGR